MKQISIDDLARVSLPDRGQRGMIAMLECYLDDSGTHNGSVVVVWGGVVGHKFYMDQLDAAWRKQLREPCEGRPPIKRFHSFDLMHGHGEFEGYTQGERDLTRRNFRQIVVECGATVIAYGASVRDWEQVMHKQVGMTNLTAEQAAFGQAVKTVLECASVKQDPVTLQFDRGRSSQALDTALDAVMDREEFGHLIVSYGYSRVEATPALQAADLVVHESYRRFVDYMSDKKARIHPHTERLFQDAHDSRGGLLGRKQIKDAARKTEKNLKHLKKRDA